MLRKAFLLAQGVVWYPVAAALTCSSADIPHPSVYGAKILSLTATEVHNYSTSVPVDGANLNGEVTHNFTKLNFCNISVAYAHPGWHDRVLVTTWLPLEGWNGRFQGTGGSGWDAGTSDFFLAPAVATGYATAKTDAGHPEGLSQPTWGLSSPGNVNYLLLQDFASVALSDMTLFGQALIESYYGLAASFSYWNGCSTGGRQGLMIAQRYSGLYDGIMAI